MKRNFPRFASDFQTAEDHFRPEVASASNPSSKVAARNDIKRRERRQCLELKFRDNRTAKRTSRSACDSKEYQ
jgi:hypothetical protein